MPSRSFRRGRLPLAGGLLVIAIVLVVVLISSGSKSSTSGTTGSSGHAIESIFQDDQLLLDQQTPQLLSTLQTLKGLGVDRLRVTVLWRTVAPNPSSSTAPAGFVASDPSDYPLGGFELYDRLVLLAQREGLTVDFNVTAAGPLWAMRGPAPQARRDYVYAPYAKDFRQFVAAVGRRYSGSYSAPAAQQRVLAELGVPWTKALPRVSFWSIWNEPNQPGWLSPQWRMSGGTRVMESPVLYRQYLDAGWRALQSTGHGPGSDTILIGELAPEGGGAADVEQPIAPLPFLQALYCVNASDQPLSGSAAFEYGCPTSGGGDAFASAHPELFDATGFAHHPYAFFLPPNKPFANIPANAGFIPLVSLSVLENALDKIFGAYGHSRKIPIYLTEYGYETNPPNPFRGVPLQTQAAYIDEAQYMASQDPRVRSMSQFLLRDAAPDTAYPVGSVGYWSSFQTGLQFVNGAKKPSFQAYRLPIWIPSTAGSSVTVWGMLRPATGSTHAVIEWRGTGGGAFRNLDTVSVGASKTFTARVTVPGAGVVRFAWTSPSGQVFRSRMASVG